MKKDRFYEVQSKIMGKSVEELKAVEELRLSALAAAQAVSDIECGLITANLEEAQARAAKAEAAYLKAIAPDHKEEFPGTNIGEWMEDKASRLEIAGE